MKRNSAGVAEQPRSKAASTEAEQSSRSAAQPAKHAPCSFTVPREYSDWLQALPEHVIAQSQPLKRVHSATAVLELSSTREQRDQIQALLNDWNVPQKPPWNVVQEAYLRRCESGSGVKSGSGNPPTEENAQRN